MPSEELPLEIWERIQDLFQKMIESEGPFEVSAEEADLTIRNAAERLYRDHRRASIEGFLDQPITFVRDLSLDAPEQFASGQLLAGRFAVQRLLGAGGMGEVYLADHTRGRNWWRLRPSGTLAADSTVRHTFLWRNPNHAA